MPDSVEAGVSAGWLRAVLGILLCLLMVPDGLAIECFTPLEWQPKLGSRWSRDANNDNVDDLIPRLGGETVDVLLDLNDCPTDADKARFAQFGTLGYTLQSISVVQLKDVRKADVFLLALDERVAMVEWDAPVHTTLDISAAALRVIRSSVYSPDTLEENAPGINGNGVNIAFLDTGVDDGVHETLPASKFVGGFDLFTGQEGNPDDVDPGHGTAVASVALSTASPDGEFRGMAPAARLIDIKVIPRAGEPGTTSGVLVGIDKCIEKRVEWKIDVMNLSLTQVLHFSPPSPSNGLDALSQAVNRAVQEGIVAVVSAGNNGLDSFGHPQFVIESPAAADDAITVADSMDRGTVFRGDDLMSPLSSKGPRVSDGDSDNTDEQKPDVAAPGSSETITVASANSVSGYARGAGSSIAAGRVAGLAALLLQANPGMLPRSIKARILDSAEDFHPPGWDGSRGRGLVDAFCAVIGGCGPQGPCRTTDLRLHSITAENPRIVSGVPNALRASVCNQGAVAATRFQVQLSAYIFGDSGANYPVCTLSVPDLQPGSCQDVRCPWTPRVSGAVPGVVHACVKGEIIYFCDPNGANNYGQRNLDIQTSQSPAEFRMQVVNPTAEDLFMEILPEFSPACSGWSFAQSAAGFPLGATGCGKVVELSLTPGAGTTASCKVEVAVEGVRPDHGRLVFNGVTLVGVVPEPDPPQCALAGVGTDALGRKFIMIHTRDLRSGLAAVNVVKSQNAEVLTPVFEVGSQEPLTITSTKLDPGQSSTTELEVFDAAGNAVRCDPVLVEIGRTAGKPVTETFTGIPQAEHFLTIRNGNPGLTTLAIAVNGRKYQLGGLRADEVRTLDVASAMRPGGGNVFSLTAHGKPGGGAAVLIHD